MTVPHKEAVVPLLDQVDEWAARAGAVNTIVNRNGRLEGLNTDGLGFLRALKVDGGLSPTGLRVLVLGAGGAAKGVCLALAGESVAAITIANRTLDRARVLAALLQEQCPLVEAIPLEGPLLAQAAQGANLIVNCTTLGMSHGSGEHLSPLSWSQIPSTALVCDLVYNPPTTPLLQEAVRAGAPILGGLPMLVYQGAVSFELWTGKEAPVEAMREAVRAALR